MNFIPAPTFIFTVFSLFRKRTEQPIFAPAIPPIPTQVYITCDTTVHVDPPVAVKSTTNGTPASGEKPKIRPLPLHLTLDLSEKQQAQLYPATPCAPNAHRLTFLLSPAHDWSNTADLVVSSGGGACGGGEQCYCDVDQASLCDADPAVPPGLEPMSRSSEPAPHTVPEPKTLAKRLFFFGFAFPAFWVAGVTVMVMPLQTTTDWEAGRNDMEIKWGRAVIRETELRWARRCLVALITEVLIVLLVVVIVKWGVMA